MPKIEETLKSNAKSQGAKKSPKLASAKAKGEGAGSRRLRLEVEIHNEIEDQAELQGEYGQSAQSAQPLEPSQTAHESMEEASGARQDHGTDQAEDSFESSRSSASFLETALKTVQQSVSLGAALAEQKFPKTKQTLEAVAQDWAQGGSFAELPIENPFLRKAVQNGLVQARDLQNKVLAHPQTEKVAMQLFTAGMKVQGLVEEIKSKVSKR